MRSACRTPIPSGCRLASAGGAFRQVARSADEIPLQERKAADGQPILVGLAVGNQAFKVGFKLGQLPLEILLDAHEVAGFLDTSDRLLENIDLRVHVGSLSPDGN